MSEKMKISRLCEKSESEKKVKKVKKNENKLFSRHQLRIAPKKSCFEKDKKNNKKLFSRHH